MNTAMRKLHRNNKRGPKSKKNSVGEFEEIKKYIKPRQLQHAINYILQHADQLMWGVLKDNNVKENTAADLWHAYGLRHACDLIEKFIYDKDNAYREDITTPKENKNEDLVHNVSDDNNNSVRIEAIGFTRS